MDCFPVVSWHHLNSVPGAPIEKRTVGSFANTFLTADAEVWINFNSSEWRMVFIGHPKHACFDRAVFNAGGRPGTTGTTVCRDCENARPLLASCFPVSLGHGPVLFYDVIHGCVWLPVLQVGRAILQDPPSWKYQRYARDSNIALPFSSTICVGSITHLPILHRSVKTNHWRKHYGNRCGNFSFSIRCRTGGQAASFERLSE